MKLRPAATALSLAVTACIVSCSIVAPIDRLHPKGSQAFLKDYDRQWLEVLKLKTLFSWLQDNSIETFKEMRAHRPIITTAPVPTKAGLKFTSTVLVANRQDVVEVLDNWDTFTVRLYGSKMDECMGAYMLGRDHTRYNLVEKPYMRHLMPSSDFPRIKSQVVFLAHKAIAEGTQTTTDKNGKAIGRIEIVNKVARRVPILLTGTYGGFPGPDEASMFRWSRATQADFFKNIKAEPPIHADAVRAGHEMTAYIDSLITEKRALLSQNPGAEDTILARMLKQDTNKVQGITDDRMIILTAGLLIGAGETTQAAVCKCLAELFTRPTELQGAIKAARENNDDLLGRYVWEALRFRPGNSVLPRYAEQDYILAKGTPRETKIAKGALVLAGTQSAMFDETFVKNPEQFRLDRPQSLYMILGYGWHRCLGDHISLIQVPQIVKALLLKKNLRPAPGKQGEINQKGGPFPEQYILEYDLN